jgi:translation initiation factor 2 subunit 1
MVSVTEISEIAVYVTLTEYDGLKGMVLLSELSRRRIRSINKVCTHPFNHYSSGFILFLQVVRVGRAEAVVVIRVDKEKGYIDLSKSRIMAGDIEKCEERFNKAKAVHGVLRQVAEQRRCRLETLYQSVGWPLYRKYGHAFDAFKLALAAESEGRETDIFEGLDVDATLRADISAQIRRKLAPQPVKVRADVAVTCFAYEGVDAVRAALTAGEAEGTPDCPVKIRLIAPPLFVVTCTTLDKEQGVELLQRTIAAVQAAIEPRGGNLVVKMAPKAVTLREETELQAMLSRLALEQEDVDGDEPDE